jgi:hypothetical protein
MRVHDNSQQMVPISHTYLMQRLQWEWSFDYRLQFTANELALQAHRMQALIDVAPPVEWCLPSRVIVSCGNRPHLPLPRSNRPLRSVPALPLRCQSPEQCFQRSM